MKSGFSNRVSGLSRVAVCLLATLALGCGEDDGSNGSAPRSEGDASGSSSNSSDGSRDDSSDGSGSSSSDGSGSDSSGGSDNDSSNEEGTTAGDEPGELGACDGTDDECEAARIINEYRAGHIQVGECNHALKWSSKIGKLAHDWQQQMGASIAHSSHGYVENVGQAYGLRATIEYIIEYDPAIGEDHCNADGSYQMSHHCAAMFCENETVGIGIYQEGDAYYVTMMFGDDSGDPDWGF